MEKTKDITNRVVKPDKLENFKNLEIEKTETSPEPEVVEQCPNKSNMPVDKLETGTIIKFKGLKGKQEFNGRFGVVKKQLENGRFQVMIDGDKDLSMKSANLETLNQCPNKQKLVEKGLLFWPLVKGFSTPAIQWLDDEVLEKAFINPYDKHSSFTSRNYGAHAFAYPTLFDYDKEEKTQVSNSRADDKPKDDAENYEDEEFMEGMMALKARNHKHFRNYDQSWRTIERNLTVDLIKDKSKRRKAMMKKYEDRLKEVLNWTDPTPWIRTITTEGAVQNQVCIYFDADSKAPVNDWLRIRFSNLKNEMPQIRGPFVFIGALNELQDQPQTEMINYHKGIFHSSKYFGQPQEEEYIANYCENLHKILAKMASANVCNDPDCKDCETAKNNHRSLSDESEKTGLSQDEILRNRGLIESIKKVCEKKGINFDKYLLELAKSAAEENPDNQFVKDYLQRNGN